MKEGERHFEGRGGRGRKGLPLIPFLIGMALLPGSIETPKEGKTSEQLPPLTQIPLSKTSHIGHAEGFVWIRDAVHQCSDGRLIKTDARTVNYPPGVDAENFESDFIPGLERAGLTMNPKTLDSDRDNSDMTVVIDNLYRLVGIVGPGADGYVWVWSDPSLAGQSPDEVVAEAPIEEGQPHICPR